MARKLKIGALVLVAFAGLALLTLRLRGFDPPYLSAGSEEFMERGRTGYPGFWLSGEVVREPVTNWDWVNEVDDPERGNTIMLETRTWYGIPHSVVINPTPRGEELYIGGSEQDFRLERDFPNSKRWWANIERDPRVRIKVDGRIYEMTAVHVADQAEVAALIGRDPVTRSVGEDGIEEITGIRHYWRMFQRNLRDYDSATDEAP